MDVEVPILIAEDDENDAIITERALRQAGSIGPIHVCNDGTAVQAYLEGNEPYGNRQQFPFPDILITDLNMPRMDGLELLKWLQETDFSVIPAVVLSASRELSDIQEAYRLGANSYLVKPGSYKELVEMMKVVLRYWAICEKPAILHHV